MAHHLPVDPDQTAAFRRFNRFHTQLVGALNDRLLASDYTLAQVRVLYEIADAPRDHPPSARDLAKRLSVDSGYLSRILARLDKAGLIRRDAAPDSAKRLLLSLTDQGQTVFAGLQEASRAQVQALLAPLPAPQRQQVTGAMDRIRRLLGDADAAPLIVLRDPVPGDLGFVVHRQAALYAQEYGWDWTFEGLVAGIMGDFVRDFTPGRHRAWIAEREGEIVGSVFVVSHDDSTAKLRMLYVDPAARGLGLGRRLVDECLRFARAASYTRMVLWTNDILVAARHIYEAAGFTLVEEEPHRSFGHDLIGQTWARDL